MGGDRVSVLLVADPGDFSGTSEAKYFLSNLSNRVPTSEKNSTVCVAKEMGTLLGQPVLVASTGIGSTAAALCVTEILQCAANIKEIIYMGTSGWSPQLGGTINPGNCSQTSTAPLTRLGDLCITPWSVNWNCKKTDYVDQCGGYPNLCNLPGDIFGPTAGFLYGDCMFSAYSMANLALSDELIGAATSAAAASNFAARSAGVAAKEQDYWGLMSNGTGINYTALLPAAGVRPAVWNYTQCVEVDSQFFYSGPPWEATARNYSALTINQALNTSLTASDVIAVAAMEAIGLAEAMTKFQRVGGSTQIPFTVIRGASNYLYKPVSHNGAGFWSYGAPFVEDIASGYAYAIASASSAVLSLFQSRCSANGGTNGACNFAVQVA
ncbi:hypothetical protein WJX72_009569 [[Myrmecia] bisecta]|uniref:Uncharacterized protein n=1 Tax=[Myrmecia] bisecta TaxID=41462 RepID=A0AAW1PP59_9CHLO